MPASTATATTTTVIAARRECCLRLRRGYPMVVSSPGFCSLPTPPSKTRFEVTGQAALAIAAYQVRMLTRTAEPVRCCVGPDHACSPITARDHLPRDERGLTSSAFGPLAVSALFEPLARPAVHVLAPLW